VSDDHPHRPFDHHVEPLFAGLGVEEPASPRPGRRLGLVRTALLVLGVSALVLWWLV
jgi:hypothetical protein